MAFEDKKLTCKDCGQEFTWTAGEQEFYAQKGFDNPPMRCPDCRKKRKEEKRSNMGERTMYDIVCSRCGNPGQVPFQPTDGREVLCRNCFMQSREN